MAFDFDVTTHYQFFHGLETVTFSNVTRAATFTQTVASAWRTAVSNVERLASSGVYTSYDSLFRLPFDTMGTATPKPADLITTSDGTIFTILTVDKYKFGGSWKCVARNLSLAYDLRDLVTILNGVTTIAADGSKVTTHTTASSNVPARIQPITVSQVDERGKRGFQKQYEVTLGIQYDFNDDDLIQDADGLKYEVISWRNKSRIDELQTVQVQRAP
jgi:hypothetical protein